MVLFWKLVSIKRLNKFGSYCMYCKKNLKASVLMYNFNISGDNEYPLQNFNKHMQKY